jgi:hypothetical protein
MCGNGVLKTFEDAAHFGHFTTRAGSSERIVRQVNVRLRTICRPPCAILEDLAVTRRTNFGLQDAIINPRSYQMFPNGEIRREWETIHNFCRANLLDSSLGR